MRKEKLNALLDSIYELEGLVHLAITRDDVPAMLPELIKRKSRELLGHAERATEDIPEPEEINIPDLEEVEIPEPLVEAMPESEPIIETEPEAAPMPEPEMIAIYTTSLEPELDEEEPVEETAPEPENMKQAKKEPVNDEPAKPDTKAYKFEDYVEPRGRLVFSINDRYRFKRELFKGSDTDFNNTLAKVASMDGYDEAEDYFLNELQWDEKSPDVIDFLEILKKYFKE